MPFGRKSKLAGPVSTVAGKADLSSAQHVLLDQVLGMCCESHNAVLEAWRYQYRWHQSRHKHDDVKLGDVYDDGRIAGGRGVLHAQFSEFRDTETPTLCGEGLLWSDLAHQIGRGLINRFDKARIAFFERCEQKKQGVKIKAGYPRFESRSRWRSIVDDPDPSMVKAPDETCGWWKLQIKGLGVIKFRPSDEVV